MVHIAAAPVAAGVEVEPAAQGAPRRALSPAEEGRRARVIGHLSDPTVIAEDAALLERQFYGVAEAFKPRNRWQEWLTARISTLMLRISRAERVERKLRDWAAYRAFDFWEEDQKLAVEELGGRLRQDPAKVAAQLRRTPAGLDWLARRWRPLARLKPEEWTDDRRELARQLLGGDDSVDPAAPGFAAAQVEALAAGRARVEEADAILRGLVESDLSDKHVPDLARLRREVRAWHREMKWCVDQFHVEHPDRWDDPMRRPAHEKVTPDGFREVDYGFFEGPRPLEPLTPPTSPSPAFAAGVNAAPSKPERPPAGARPAEVAAARRLAESVSLPAGPPAASFVAVAASRPSSPPPVVHDYSNESGRGHARPLRPGEPSRAYRKKLRQARRRTERVLGKLP